MSLINVLNTARKLGIPVVITNDRGKSPQVVLPFEDFVSMVNGSQSNSCPYCKDFFDDEDDVFEDDEDDDEEEMPSIEEMNRWAKECTDEEPGNLTPKEIEELDKKFIVEDDKITVEPIVQPSDFKESKGVVEPTSVSLEDQFYFDPNRD
jgi:hypothetical protein